MQSFNHTDGFLCNAESLILRKHKNRRYSFSCVFFSFVNDPYCADVFIEFLNKIVIGEGLLQPHNGFINIFSRRAVFRVLVLFIKII